MPWFSTQSKKRLIFRFLPVILTVLTTAIFPGCSPVLLTTTLTPAAVDTAPAQPTNTRVPSPTPTRHPTIPPVYLDALVWKTEPSVPVILYHRFILDKNPESSKTKLRLAEFENHLQTLYDHGYRLVPLEKWLDGDLTIPTGTRPLVLTMDDAFFADQVFLNDDGTPSEKSGIGILWKFNQTHPDFGFYAALFANLGDKYYANIDYKDVFIYDEHWQESLQKVIVWCIEHDIMPYDHLYHHPRLDLTDSEDVPYEMSLNDRQLRKYLQAENHSDLISKVSNIIALPYGAWPPAKGADQLIIDYQDPEGRPVKAVLEANYYHDENNLLYSVYSSRFNRYHIPRITMNTQKALNYLVENPNLVPAAETCRLGPVNPAETRDPDKLIGLIKDAQKNGSCRPGYYWVNGFYFDASGSSITQGKVPAIGQP